MREIDGRVEVASEREVGESEGDGRERAAVGMAEREVGERRGERRGEGRGKRSDKR